MCGITGQVGIPTNPIQSYNLATNLLRETQRRGKHATGFFSIDLDNKPLHHKAPVSAEFYIHRPEWKQTIKGNVALIGHARFTTNGAANINGNNHPHLSKSGNMALVHNGIVYNYEEMKDSYEKYLISDCDSELILRIIAKEKDPLHGIKKVFKLLGSGGDFACELIHFNPKTKKTTFYFFRDNGRPGKIIDARESLGQIMFCSETEIWKEAVLKAGMPRNIRQLEVCDIPDYKIISIDASTLKIKEYDVEKPVYKTTHHRSWKKTSHHINGYNYDDEYYICAPSSTQQKTNHSICNVDRSVLKKGWIETVDPDTRLPRFIFDPDETEENIEEDNVLVEFNENKTGISKTSSENQDIAFKTLLRQCVNDPTQRYPGWQDEAFSYSLISEKEWFEFSNEDNTDDTCLDNELQTQDDERMLIELAQQQMVDGDEGENYI